MGMGDAIHLATALHFEVAEMQTLDGAGKRKRKYDLLRLDGNVAGARLAIKMPKYIAPPQPLEGPLRTGSTDRSQGELFKEGPKKPKLHKPKTSNPLVAQQILRQAMALRLPHQRRCLIQSPKASQQKNNPTRAIYHS